MLDQVGNQNVGFLMTRLICSSDIGIMIIIPMNTVIFLSFWSERPQKTVQSDNRLLLKDLPWVLYASFGGIFSMLNSPFDEVLE